MNYNAYKKYSCGWFRPQRDRYDNPFSSYNIKLCTRTELTTKLGRPTYAQHYNWNNSSRSRTKSSHAQRQWQVTDAIYAGLVCRLQKRRGAVKLLSAELSDVSKIRDLTVKLVRVAEKSLLPSKDRHYVSDWCQRKRTYQQTICSGFFCFGDEIYDDMPLLD